MTTLPPSEPVIHVSAADQKELTRLREENAALREEVKACLGVIERQERELYTLGKRHKPQ